MSLAALTGPVVQHNSVTYVTCNSGNMDGTPTSLFESYEQDFLQIVRSISDKLEGSGKDQRGGAFNIHTHPHSRTDPFGRTTQSSAEEGRA
jgi:hypothetical protein